MGLIYEKTVPVPFTPASVVAIDTNESSRDGVRADPEGATYVRAIFPELREIQARHFSRRRFLGRKKAHDRRLMRRLHGREGRRERHRIRTRLHKLTRTLIDDLARTRAALVLEDLSSLPKQRRGSRSLRRRLSSWPRAELHRQLVYKAEEEGVPVCRVNPYRTLIACPRCGDITKPRRRVGPRFECSRCGWQTDRQLNAGVNIRRAGLREHAELGGLRLDPDALSEDAVKLLYPTEGTPTGTSRAEGKGGRPSGVPRLRAGVSR